MTTNEIAVLAILVVVVVFLLYVPLVKPWFGFKRPPGHRGRWWE